MYLPPALGVFDLLRVRNPQTASSHLVVFSFSATIRQCLSVFLPWSVGLAPGTGDPRSHPRAWARSCLPPAARAGVGGLRVDLTARSAAAFAAGWPRHLGRSTPLTALCQSRFLLLKSAGTLRGCPRCCLRPVNSHFLPCYFLKCCLDEIRPRHRPWRAPGRPLGCPT